MDHKDIEKRDIKIRTKEEEEEEEEEEGGREFRRIFLYFVGYS